MTEKRCKWTGQPRCHLHENHKGCLEPWNIQFEPFEFCDFKVLWARARTSCQPSTMGFLTKEDYLKEVINDPNKLTFYG